MNLPPVGHINLLSSLPPLQSNGDVPQNLITQLACASLSERNEAVKPDRVEGEETKDDALKVIPVQPNIVVDLSPNNIQKIWNETTIKIVREITQDAERRAQSKSVKELNEGFFYPSVYQKLLKAMNNKSATARRDLMLKNGTFMHGSFPKEYFEKILLPPREDVAVPLEKYYFKIREGQLPTQALNAAKRGLSVSACGEVCFIASYFAIREILGTDKFNAIFASDSKTPLVISSDLSLLPINFLCKYDEHSFKTGSIYTFQSSKAYNYKHFYGEGQAFNVICSDTSGVTPKFVGFGLNVNGVTEKELKAHLLDSYNSPPTPIEDIVSGQARKKLDPYFQQVVVLEDGTSFEEFRKTVQDQQFSLEEFECDGFGEGGSKPDIDRLILLAKATPVQAKKLLEMWKAKDAKKY